MFIVVETISVSHCHPLGRRVRLRGSGATRPEILGLLLAWLWDSVLRLGSSTFFGEGLKRLLVGLSPLHSRAYGVAAAGVVAGVSFFRFGLKSTKPSTFWCLEIYVKTPKKKFGSNPVIKKSCAYVLLILLLLFLYSLSIFLLFRYLVGYFIGVLKYFFFLILFNICTQNTSKNIIWNFQTHLASNEPREMHSELIN